MSKIYYQEHWNKIDDAVTEGDDYADGVDTSYADYIHVALHWEYPTSTYAGLNSTPGAGGVYPEIRLDGTDDPAGFAGGVDVIAGIPALAVNGFSVRTPQDVAFFPNVVQLGQQIRHGHAGIVYRHTPRFIRVVPNIGPQVSGCTFKVYVYFWKN